MKVIIAGGRNIKDYKLVEQAIQESGFKITEVVSGDARGVDTMGAYWANRHCIPVKHFPARWDDLTEPTAKIGYHSDGQTYNKLAGFQRNQEMAEYVGPEGGLILIWDGQSSGSASMKRLAEEKRLKVYEKIVS